MSMLKREINSILVLLHYCRKKGFDNKKIDVICGRFKKCGKAYVETDESGKERLSFK